MTSITADAELPPASATGDGEVTATTGQVEKTTEEPEAETATTGSATEDTPPITAGETSPPPPRDIEAIKAAALAAATQPTVKKTPKIKASVVKTASNIKKKGKKGKRSAPPRPTLVVKLGPNDVLMGRGSLFADYEGNVRLRAVVQDHRDAYAASSKHKDKQQIVRSIIEAVQSLGGRFLRRVELSKEQKKTKDAANPPSHMWSVIDEEKLVIDKVKQLFRDARLTRQMRRRKNPMEEGDLSQTEIAAPRLTIPPGQPNPPGVTAPPGSVEQQLQLQRLQQQQQQQKQEDEKNPLEEQLRQQRQRQSSLEQQIRQQKQVLKQQKKKSSSNNKAASASSPAMTQAQQQQQQQPQLQTPPNLQTPTGGMGMNHIPPTAMNHLGGMNFNTGDMGQQLGVFQFQQQEQLVALRAEQERQELAMRAEQMRQEQERQELTLRAEQMRQEQERQGMAIRAEQDRQQQQQQDTLRQQQEFQAFRAEQERQELANLLRANHQARRNDPLRQFAAAQQPMGMMQNQDTAFPGSFGAFPPDSLNRANNQGVGRSGLVDLARLAEIMQVTGPFPNQLNNQGGQQM